MPVRSLNSSVLKWPNQAQVVAALQDWVPSAIKAHPETLRLGYFSSYGGPFKTFAFNSLISQPAFYNIIKYEVLFIARL